jgi:hypothetical protein
MDLGKQFYGTGVIGIEDQDLSQEAIHGREIAFMMGVDGVVEEIARVLSVVFALFVGPAPTESLFAAFLAGGLRHAKLRSR